MRQYLPLEVEIYKKPQRRKEDYGAGPIISASARLWRDDEEERVSKISAEALPHRSGAHAAGKYAGDRKTEKLRPDRNGKYLCVCPSDCEKHFSDQEEKICVES